MEDSDISISQGAKFCRPDDWEGFVQFVRHTNRFALTDYWQAFFTALKLTAKKRTAIIRSGSEFFRARNGIRHVEQEFDDEITDAYSKQEMGPPPPHLASEGRLNPAGIPYLYLASDIKTTIAEVRPWIGLALTVARFETTKNLRVVDTRHDKRNEFIGHLLLGKLMAGEEDDPGAYTDDEKEGEIWGAINVAFSWPTSPHESHLNYLPTQYLAEVLKVDGYDGVLYTSSLNPKGYNLTLFDSAGAACTYRHVYLVTALKYESERME